MRDSKKWWWDPGCLGAYGEPALMEMHAEARESKPAGGSYSTGTCGSGRVPFGMWTVSSSHFAIRILNARRAVLPQCGSDTTLHVTAGGAHCRKEREIPQAWRPGCSWQVRGQRLLFFGGKSKEGTRN